MLTEAELFTEINKNEDIIVLISNLRNLIVQVSETAGLQLAQLSDVVHFFYTFLEKNYDSDKVKVSFLNNATAFADLVKHFYFMIFVLQEIRSKLIDSHRLTYENMELAGSVITALVKATTDYELTINFKLEAYTIKKRIKADLVLRSDIMVRNGFSVAGPYERAVSAFIITSDQGESDGTIFMTDRDIIYSKVQDLYNLKK